MISRWFVTLFILLLFFGLVNPSYSQVGAIRNPSISFLDAYVTADSYISTNPGLVPITNSEGYSHTTHIEADRNTGHIKGYAGYNLDSAKLVTRNEDLISYIAGTDQSALIANITGFIDYETNVMGPVGVGPTFATVFIEVEGSFNYVVGTPALNLFGGVSIGVTRGGNPFDTQTYIFGGEFTNFDGQTWIPDSDTVTTSDGLQVYGGMGEPVLFNPTISGVTTNIQYLSMDPDALKMRAELTVPVQDGDVWYLEGYAGGCATHAFLEDFRQVELGEMGQVDAATGYVDFLGTASMGIELPEGFSLEGENAPPLSIISSSSQVPLPGAIWLLGSGLLCLVGIRRQ